MIQVDGMSAWVISEVALETKGPANPVLQLNGALTVAGSSMLALRGNVLQMASAGSLSCIDLGSMTERYITHSYFGIKSKQV